MTPSPAPDRPSREARLKALARPALTGFFALAIIGGAAVWIAAFVRKPGLEGFFGGLFGGLVVFLLIMAAGAWISIGLATSRPKPVDAPLAPGEVDAGLEGVLRELEATRQDVVRQINQRAAWRVPLCVAAGLAVWILGQFSGEPGDIEDLLAMLIVPGLGGYAWASLKLSNGYAKLYKSRVLPRLAAMHGGLDYRHAVMPDMARLLDEGLFREAAHATADDEIFGTWRGLPINIVELKLERGSGKNRRTIFDGLLVDIELPRDTQAVTAVVADAGDFGNFRDRMKTERQRVRLEDPVFEKVYEVYGTDQVAARALLHPAFMEKFLALGELPEFGRPLALVTGRRMTLAMPKRLGKNLFEAPSFRKPAASRLALEALNTDIAAVLAAADAVIGLDHRFAGPAQ